MVSKLEGLFDQVMVSGLEGLFGQIMISIKSLTTFQI